MRLTKTEYSRRWRRRNPMKAAYNNLRNNAKRRGKEFSLSYEQFEEFAVYVKIQYGAKRNAETWSIDRIDPEKGYSIDNIQPLTLQQNTKKQHCERRHFEFINNYTAARVKTIAHYNYSNSPF